MTDSPMPPAAEADEVTAAPPAPALVFQSEVPG